MQTTAAPLPRAHEEEGERRDVAPVVPAEVAAPTPPEPPQTRSYTLIKAVTQTPHGSTWLAVDERGRRVALRELLIAGAEAKQEEAALTEVRGPRQAQQSQGSTTQARRHRTIAALLIAAIVAVAAFGAVFSVARAPVSVPIAKRQYDNAWMQEQMDAIISSAEHARRARDKDDMLERATTTLDRVELALMHAPPGDTDVASLRARLTVLRASVKHAGSQREALFLLEDAVRLEEAVRPRTASTTEVHGVREAPARPSPGFGYFAFTTSPVGAEVWVDGKNTGFRTPVSRQDALPLPAGPHKLQFKLDGRSSNEIAMNVLEDVKPVVLKFSF